MNDRKCVVLKAPNIVALRRLINQTPLDLDTDGPLRQEDGAVTIKAFVNSDDLDLIGKNGRIEIIDVIDLRDPAAMTQVASAV